MTSTNSATRASKAKKAEANDARTVQEMAAAALAERQAAATRPPAADESSIETQAVAAMMRERDHLEGCPVHRGQSGYGSDRVEAYEQRVTAPSPGLTQNGVSPGETIVVLHCQECGQLRYFPQFTTRDEFLDASLTQLAGEPEPEPADDLDGTLA